MRAAIDDGARWRAMVQNGWTMWWFPSIDDGNPWRCIAIVGEGPGLQHVVGRGRSAEEAIDAAILQPEWTPGDRARSQHRHSRKETGAAE